MKPGTLFVCSTPIGNLGDLSPRLADVLAQVAVVAVEDTRVSSKVLERLGVKAKMVTYNDENEAETAARLAEELRSGESVAVMSDAGTPAISDPGYRLVLAAIEAGADVRSVPGASAVTAALSISGLPTDRFVFDGFLPRKPLERKTRLEELATEERTVVVFESPHRLKDALADIEEVFGARRLALCREMTKLHEEVVRGSAAEIADQMGDRPRGEMVLVIEGATPQMSLAEVVETAKELVRGGAKSSAAAAEAARGTPFKRSDVYDALRGSQS